MTSGVASRGQPRLRFPILVAALLLASSLAPRAAMAQCSEDAAGMCERPIACNPPAGGKCTTVAIPRPLTGHKFECRCVAAKPANVSTGANCRVECQTLLRQCEQRPRTPNRPDACEQKLQRCEQDCR